MDLKTLSKTVAEFEPFDSKEKTYLVAVGYKTFMYKSLQNMHLAPWVQEGILKSQEWAYVERQISRLIAKYSREYAMELAKLYSKAQLQKMSLDTNITSYIKQFIGK